MNMKRLLFAGIISLVSLLDAFGLPADLDAPPAAFGDAERDGTLLVTDDLRDVDFGGGVRLPVRWVYRSSDQSTNAYGWDGFSLTIAESKAVKKTDVLYEVTLLCGKVIYFSKQMPGVTPQWKSNDGQWAGLEDAENEKFTMSRWDGWKLEFVSGRIKKLTTEDGRTLLWTYDSTDNRLVANIREVGQDPKLELILSNDPLKMAGSSAVRGAYQLEVNGDTYTFKYGGGTLKDIEFPDGRKTQWRFENNGEIAGEKRLTLTQETGWWRSWVFLDESRLLKSDDVWSYSMVGGAPAEDGVVYNRPTMERTRMATGEKEKVEYDAANSITISTDVLGNVQKSYAYKTQGKLYDKAFKIESKRAGESGFTTVWRGTYDSATGDLIRSYDADGNETQYTIERFAGANEFMPPKKETTTDPLGRTKSIERDTNGNLYETVDAAGVHRKFEWDSRRRLTRIRNAANEVLSRVVYGDKDEILESYDALGNKTSFEYSVHLGEPLLVKCTTPEGRVTEWQRDDKGRVVKTTAPSGGEWSQSFVGDWSVAQAVSDPLNNTASFEYDDRLNETKTVDASNNESTTVYDDLDLPVEVKDALGQVTKYDWNANGEMKKATDARNKVYTFGWGESGQRKEMVWPDSVKQTTSFDAVGRVAHFSPRGTAVVSNSWNAAGDLIGQVWTNGALTGTNSLTMNGAGQISGLNSTSRGLTLSGTISYDAEGRPVSVSQSVGGVTRTASASYNLDGSLKSITYPAGFVVEYAYNGDGQIVAVKKDGSTIASYAYDAAGRMASRTLSSGVVTTFGYDGADRLNGLVVASGSSALWAERYGFNASGKRAYTLTGTTGTAGDVYQTDANSQLTGVKYGASNASGGYGAASGYSAAAQWGYDAAGNRASQTLASGTTTYLVNDNNQYTSLSGAMSGTLTYTDRGDLATSGDWQYSYDAYGNLAQATNSVTSTDAKYWANAFGHRTVKEVNGAQTVFFNLGAFQLETYDVNSGSVSSTIYEPGLDKPLAEVDGSGITAFYHLDGLGSVALLTGPSGSKLQAYSYDVWGKVSASDATGATIGTSAIASRFLYTAREYDRETGLYHYRARAYSPELGRFIQNDPVDFAGGDSNLLRYVFNDPMDWTDPEGLKVCNAQELASARAAYKACMSGAYSKYVTAVNNAKKLQDDVVKAAKTVMDAEIGAANTVYQKAKAVCQAICDPGDKEVCLTAAAAAYEAAEGAAQGAFAAAKTAARTAKVASITAARVKRALDEAKCLDAARAKCSNF
jgi:RHS repeat-associated protein